jgi:hypothetical protein
VVVVVVVGAVVVVEAVEVVVVVVGVVTVAVATRPSLLSLTTLGLRSSSRWRPKSPFVVVV